MSTIRQQQFDQKYYDKWYRSEKHRVRFPSAVRRHALLAISAAEYLLERPVRSVLDIGCGEGDWERALRAVRPRMRYMGIDPSEYVVRRFGRKRNIELGDFGSLATRDDLDTYDLVVCVDALPYVSPEDIAKGGGALGEALQGVALLHAFTTEDDIEGDVKNLQRRPAAWYRRMFSKAGLLSVGLGLWTAKNAELVSALESA